MWIKVNFVIAFAYLALSNLYIVSGELYTSMEELKNLVELKDKILNIVGKHIHLEENRLIRLRDLQTKLHDGQHNKMDPLHPTMQLYSHQLGKKLVHPIKTFVILNRLINDLDKVGSLFEEEDGTGSDSGLISEFEQIKAEYNLPSEDDLIGCGKAILRLQVFYELNLDNIARGILNHIPETDNNVHYVMSPIDCMTLGKIAYEDGQYSISIDWFRKAIDILEEDKLNLNHDYSLEDIFTITNEALEYMAFAAYKNGQIKYSAQLTKVWLENDPNNERAKDNLEYYREELAMEAKSITKSEELGDVGDLPKTPNKSVHSVAHQEKENIYSLGLKFDSADYIVTEDKVVRDLCRTDLLSNSHLTCTKKSIFSSNHMNIQIETLHFKPDIIRIHNIISDFEAKHLRKLATPRLKRSTVQTKAGLVTSDFRIAKTAWLSQGSDPIVERVELRLSEILNLNLENSEDLQVVNYDVGGFYGPHLDSARESNQTSSASLINQLANNDRMVTILIYLNQVEAGGSTVFPRLGLSVKPIERSAVIWYNILRNGLTDEKTLHTACPVLLGTKWIATKWIREEANSFLRPCSLKSDD